MKNKEQYEQKRATLIKLSDYARTQIQAKQLDISINDYLRYIHFSHLGLKTFVEWKNAGYTIKKGARSVALWGSPIVNEKVKTNPTTNEKTTEFFKFWPLVYYFSQNDVVKMND